MRGNYLKMNRHVDQFPHGKLSVSLPHPQPLSRARERGAEGGGQGLLARQDTIGYH